MANTEQSTSRKTVYETLFDESRGFPLDDPIIVNAENSSEFLTRGDLKRKIPIFAGNMRKAWPEFKIGDTVILCSPNEINLVIAAQGFVYAGGTVASLDHTLTVIEKLVLNFKTADAKYIITHTSMLDRMIEAAAQCDIPTSKIIVCGDGTVEDKDILHLRDLIESDNADELYAPPVARAPLDPAYIYFTSGSTGINKGVLISFKALFFHLEQNTLAIPDRSRFLSSSQFFHITFMVTTLHVCIATHTTTYIMDSFELHSFCKHVEHYKPDSAMILPGAAANIARYPQVAHYDMSSIRNLYVMGEYLDQSVVEDYKEFRGLTVTNSYGMTETCAFMIIPGQKYTEAGAIGPLAKDTYAKLIDDDGNESNYGEMYIKGPSITVGYRNNQKANDESFEDGYFKTGDIFSVDEHGVYSYVTRKKEMIRFGYKEMYPCEVENVVMRAPHVAQCAVVGIRDPVLHTQMVTAFVEIVKPSDGSVLDERKLKYIAQDIMDYVNENVVEDYHRLRGGILIVDEIPRTSLGKKLLNNIGQQTSKFRHAVFQEKTDTINMQTGIDQQQLCNSFSNAAVII